MSTDVEFELRFVDSADRGGGTVSVRGETGPGRHAHPCSDHAADLQARQVGDPQRGRQRRADGRLLRADRRHLQADPHHSGRQLQAVGHQQVVALRAAQAAPLFAPPPQHQGQLGVRVRAVQRQAGRPRQPQLRGQIGTKKLPMPSD